MEDLKILMTGAGAPGAPSIIKCLRNNGERNITIIGADMNEQASSRDLVDKFYQIHPASEADLFIKDIINICKKEGCSILVSFITRELSVIAKNKDLLSQNNIKTGVLTYEQLEIVNNKLNLMKFLEENNIPCAKFIKISNVEELKNACEKLGYPENKVVVKSALGNGSRGIRVLEEGKDRFDDFFNKKPSSMSSTLGEIVEIFKDRELPEMFVMEYLPGKEYSVDVLAENGNIKYISGRLCSLVVNSITMECELKKDDKAYEVCEKIIKKLNITGNIGFDFKANENDEQILMEINPRLTATVALNEKGGVNFPYLGIKQVLNEALPDITVDYGVSLRRRYNEVYFDKLGNEIK